VKLLSAPTSPFARKVRIVALETGLMNRIEIVPTATAPLQPQSELSRENPLGKIPVLVLDDGEQLFDSLVICDYLDSLHGGERVIPQSAPQRWQVLRLHAVGAGIGDAAVLARYEESLRAPSERSSTWARAQMGKIANALDWLEARTATIGDPEAVRADIGQISVAAGLGYVGLRFPQFEWRPKWAGLAAWFDRFSQRESMRRTAPPAPAVQPR
jgi:glutathione S-transferase